MRILYVKPSAREKEAVGAALEEHDLVFVDTLDGLDNALCESVEILSVFVDTSLDAQTLDRFSNLKLIATRSTGFDHIDSDYAGKRGIPVVHVPRYGSQTVAEYTLALMFALARNTFAAYADMRSKAAVINLEPYEGCNLMGKSLGVIGTGLIGQRVCAMASCLGMQVFAYDQFPNEALQASVAYVDLDVLLRESDFVTIHVPSTPQTRHLLNAEKIALLKRSAYLINTARGDIIETHALLSALKEGRIRGAALDVLEGEKYLKGESSLTAEEMADSHIQESLRDNHELILMDNVIVTPHIAFDTREAKEEILETAVATIRAFAEGEIINKIPA